MLNFRSWYQTEFADHSITCTKHFQSLEQFIRTDNRREVLRRLIVVGSNGADIVRPATSIISIQIVSLQNSRAAAVTREVLQYDAYIGIKSISFFGLQTEKTLTLILSRLGSGILFKMTANQGPSSDLSTLSALFYDAHFTFLSQLKIKFPILTSSFS